MNGWMNKQALTHTNSNVEYALMSSKPGHSEAGASLGLISQPAILSQL